MMQNKSSNAILVDETVVQNEEVVDIKCGTEIIPGPNREGYLNYRFKVLPVQESGSQILKISIDIEHAKCCICLNIWHDAVTVAPCFHNFCNGCFSEWLRRSQAKRSSVLCPNCRAVVQFVGRNHYLHNTEQSILLADSSLKRSDEEVALLDSYASIKSNLVIRNGKKLHRKRAHSPQVEEGDSTELPCPQCGYEVNGFHCNQNTVHLQCQACGGMMPSRSDIGVPQHCLGCDRAFCGTYWHAQMVTRSDSHPLCSHETFKPIWQRTLSSIPFLAHEMNRHEQDITERCIRKTGRTLQNVISDWVEKLNNKEIDRTRMPLNHAEAITAGTHICNDCYDKLVSFLLYWFRITLPKYILPEDAKEREDCWYGYACRTQHHNEQHARKRNHVCRPTRLTH
ncbi:E3 ubiquitin-protein ligase CHFR [Melia azedarach]|uniref:E3 ubiquitin-protein ligase CHFR n=1 Tax=Melia azedarach TaxID=155640 RepID=A0ACC1XUL3_MELAZ|nr:E3 ubiquitin-protein ligase CHFR [Melia azedarach]